MDSHEKEGYYTLACCARHLDVPERLNRQYTYSMSCLYHSSLCHCFIKHSCLGIGAYDWYHNIVWRKLCKLRCVNVTILDLQIISMHDQNTIVFAEHLAESAASSILMVSDLTLFDEIFIWFVFTCHRPLDMYACTTDDISRLIWTTQINCNSGGLCRSVSCVCQRIQCTYV